MIVQIEESLGERALFDLIGEIEALGFEATQVVTQKQSYIVVTGKGTDDIRAIGHLKGVSDVHSVKDSYQLVSRAWKVKRTTIDLGDGVTIGDGKIAIMAGPCSIEGVDQVDEIASFLAENRVAIMRGGAFKPRSSPYSFQGMGQEGLQMFAEGARAQGLKIITEVLAPQQIESMLPFVDIFQVGARNTQNFTLLQELGKVDKPVLLKRGISGTLEELLQSAEYIFSSGNEKIILCERGIRTFEKAYRNTLDINAIPVLKDKSHLPVVVDPSHGIGIRKFVEPVALAGVVAGADGVLVEIHPVPEEAFSDAAQTLNFKEAQQLFTKIRGLESFNGQSA
jgi:3-deoxy-7-phosphoheptulonate synthase